MPISTTLAGASLGRHETTMTTRRMLAYAAGIGDLAPQVFDDLHPQFMASPAMCVAIEWPLLIAPANRALMTADAAEAARVVHVVQDSRFHRPVRSGDHLCTEGVIDGVWRRRSGAAVASTLRTTDAEGRPVVTSRLESVYLGVEVSGDDRPFTAVAAVELDEVGDGARTVSIATDPTLAHTYTECSGIWNPIHTERAAALAIRLPDRILHGTASWALAGREIVRAVAGGDASRLTRLRGRFGAMVVAGAVLELRYSVVRCDGAEQVAFELLDGEGRAVIADGMAVVESGR